MAESPDQQPPDQMPATAGRSGLRASDADRERVIGTLKAAFVQGRLDQDEFSLRVGQALASRTYAELAVVTADLPAGLAATPPPAPARAQGDRRPLRPGRMVAAASVLYAAMWPLAMMLPVTSSEGDPMDGMNLVGLATLVYILVLVSIGIWAQNSGSQQKKRSGGQLPGQPAQDTRGQAPQRRPDRDGPTMAQTALPTARCHRETPVPAQRAATRSKPRPLWAPAAPGVTGS